jgi:solute carrier family 50 (sugar transporter)
VSQFAIGSDMSSLEPTAGIENFLVRTLAPVLGVIMSEFLAFGPLPAVLQCRKAKSMGEVNPFLFPLLFGNGIGWVIYASATRNLFVFLGNIGAVGLSLFYLLTAHTLAGCDDVRKKLEIMTLFLVSMWGTAGFVAAMLEDKMQAIAMIGILGNIIVFLMFASPLSTFPKVIKKKNSSSINRPFAICQVLNCVVWVAYGTATNDLYVAMPNVAGLILGIVQMVLILRYPAISCVVDVEARAPNYAAFSNESEDQK